MRISYNIAFLQICQTLFFAVLIGAIVYFGGGATVAKWEQENIHDAILRIMAAWEEQLENLDSIAVDWGAWDEIYNAMDNPKTQAAFNQANFSTPTIYNLRVNGVIVIDRYSHIIFSKEVDLRNNNEVSIDRGLLQKISAVAIDRGKALKENQNISGFLMYKDTPVLFAAHHILNGEDRGPSKGYIIFYRKADELLWQKIRERTRTTIFGSTAIKDGNEKFGGFLFNTVIQDNKIDIYVSMQDVYGKPAFSLALETERGMYNYGKDKLWQFIIITLIFACISSFIFWKVLYKMLDSRIAKIDEFMHSILKTQDLSVRLGLSEDDEFSRVALTMNAMLDKIEQSNRENQNLFNMTQYEIRERKLIEEELRYQGTHDSLTNLYNRAYFEDYTTKLEGKNTNVGIVFCDVDGLKLINDSLGHERGDRVLIEVAGIIKRSVSTQAVVARIGGDEFVVLVENLDDSHIQALVNDLRIKIEISASDKFNEISSIAIGWASTGEGIQSRKSIRTAIKKADDSMYRQKLARESSTRHVLIQGMMEMLKVRDFITEGHSQRLQERITLLAKRIGLFDSQIADLILLAQFHDVGKVGISDAILFKPGKLTPEEQIEMQRHSEIGYRIAQSIPELIPISDLILKHHEWWDGTGYPLGLERSDIPVEDRILAIADAYDAMTNERPYRKAMPKIEAIQELLRFAGRQFDPYLVELFVEIVKDEISQEATKSSHSA